MSDKIRFFNVVVFATDDYQGQPKQMEISVPIDVISHLTEIQQGNPRAGYNAYVKNNHAFNLPFKIKSINAGRLSFEQVELLKSN